MCCDPISTPILSPLPKYPTEDGTVFPKYRPKKRIEASMAVTETDAMSWKTRVRACSFERDNPKLSSHHESAAVTGER